MKNHKLKIARQSSGMAVDTILIALSRALGDQASALIVVVPSADSGHFKPYDLPDCAVAAVSEQLCYELLPLSQATREREVEKIISQMVRKLQQPVVWLDRIQILFEPSLQLDPLRLLKSMARIKPVVVTWPGLCDETALSFSTPGRSDYKNYPASELTNNLVICLSAMETK